MSTLEPTRYGRNINHWPILSGINSMQVILKPNWFEYSTFSFSQDSYFSEVSHFQKFPTFFGHQFHEGFQKLSDMKGGSKLENWNQKLSHFQKLSVLESWTAEIKNYRKWNAVESLKPEMKCSSKLENWNQNLGKPWKFKMSNSQKWNAVQSWKPEMKCSSKLEKWNQNLWKHWKFEIRNSQKWNAVQSWKPEMKCSSKLHEIRKFQKWNAVESWKSEMTCSSKSIVESQNLQALIISFEGWQWHQLKSESWKCKISEIRQKPSDTESLENCATLRNGKSKSESRKCEIWKQEIESWKCEIPQKWKVSRTQTMAGNVKSYTVKCLRNFRHGNAAIRNSAEDVTSTPIDLSKPLRFITMENPNNIPDVLLKSNIQTMKLTETVFTYQLIFILFDWIFIFMMLFQNSNKNYSKYMQTYI